MDLKQQLMLAHQMMYDFEIPLMPPELVEMQRMFAESEYPDMNQVVALIEPNKILVGEIIRLANHPLFLRKGADQVRNIKGALDALGVGRLKNLVIGLGFKTQVQNRVSKDVFNHSIDVARVAAALSRSIEGVDTDEAYLIGLFHNSGALILDMRFQDYQEHFNRVNSNCYSGLIKEAHRYKVPHNVYGSLVSKKWNLENVFTQVILLHHQKHLNVINNERVRRLVAMLQLANCIVGEINYGAYIGGEVKEMFDNAQEQLKIAESALDDIRRSIMENQL